MERIGKLQPLNSYGETDNDYRESYCRTKGESYFTGCRLDCVYHVDKRCAVGLVRSAAIVGDLSDLRGNLCQRSGYGLG